MAGLKKKLAQVGQEALERLELPVNIAAGVARIELLGSGALAILLLRQAETAAQAVRDGVQLCLTSVIPALFPFFAVSSLLVALGAAEAAGRALARPFGRLFRCGGAGCAALLLGLVGG